MQSKGSSSGGRKSPEVTSIPEYRNFKHYYEINFKDSEEDLLEELANDVKEAEDKHINKEKQAQNVRDEYRKKIKNLVSESFSGYVLSVEHNITKGDIEFYFDRYYQKDDRIKPKADKSWKPLFHGRSLWPTQTNIKMTWEAFKVFVEHVHERKANIKTEIEEILKDADPKEFYGSYFGISGPPHSTISLHGTDGKDGHVIGGVIPGFDVQDSLGKLGISCNFSPLTPVRPKVTSLVGTGLSALQQPAPVRGSVAGLPGVGAVGSVVSSVTVDSVVYGGLYTPEKPPHSPQQPPAPPSTPRDDDDVYPRGDDDVYMLSHDGSPSTNLGDAKKEKKEKSRKGGIGTKAPPDGTPAPPTGCRLG